VTSDQAANGPDSRRFSGFKPLDANYIYCPNDFFEVCLRHQSRVVVRLVGYILRETLGHLDKEGSPVRRDFSLSYLDIARGAGVSLRSVRIGLDEAIAGNFIACVTPGEKKSRGRSGRVAEFRLRWNEEGDSFTNDPQQFNGFYAGEGFRSPIPNGFFDIVIREETLAMAKVVGTVLRHTVGYANQFGTGRRSHAPLSYSYIQQFANIGDRTTLSKALADGIQKNYIQCVSRGRFDKNAGKESFAARYAVKWLDGPKSSEKTAKSLPDNRELTSSQETAKPRPGYHGETPTGEGAENRPASDGKIPTDRKTSSTDSCKQQPVVVENSKGYELLVREGIAKSTAIALAKSAELTTIENQIAWIDFREPKNRPAMLVRAIDENWSQPPAVSEKQQQEQSRDREEQEHRERQEREAKIVAQKQERQERRTRRLTLWRRLTREEQRKWGQIALQQATSTLQKRAILDSSLDEPASEVLDVMTIAETKRGSLNDEQAVLTSSFPPHG
jgi:hypothetical protein